MPAIEGTGLPPGIGESLVARMSPGLTSLEGNRSMKNNPTHPALFPGHPAWKRGPNGGILEKGKIIRRNNEGKEIGVFHFVFNPPSININYVVDPSIYNPEINGEVGTPQVSLIAATTSLSFSLLVDRTFEVNEGSIPIGAYRDMIVFENIAGGYGNGQLVAVPLEFYFGGENAFSFRGHITGATAEVTHFTPSMIPMRYALSISAIRYATNPNYGGGTTASWGQVFQAPTGQPASSSLSGFFDVLPTSSGTSTRHNGPGGHLP